METNKKTEEEQKDLIFDIYLKWQNSTNSDCTQTNFLKFYDQILKWYKNYHPKILNNMGEEIVKVFNKLIEEKERKLNLPKDKDGFFKYLNTSINNEKLSSIRDFDEKKAIKITKYAKAQLKEINLAIEDEEDHLRRKLTGDEHDRIITKTMKKQRYIEILNAKNTGSLSFTINNDNKEVDALNFISNLSITPHDELHFKNSAEIEREAVKTLLEKTQARARDCLKALFTRYCIKNGLKHLFSVLDQEMIDNFNRGGKIPKQYEIYIQYHPETNKSSAEASASAVLKEFKTGLKAYLKK